MNIRLTTVLSVLLFALTLPSQDAPPPSNEKIEQLVAPIALYPDALLTQVLMASTYPLEVVEAARWVEKNAQLKGDALEKALQDETWDPSVKSLCGLPDVLQRMSKNLDWTQDLGDAFLADQAKLMDTVQHMRRKALEAGHLESSDELKVTEQDDKIIVVESADPKVVYVPVYYPTVVYGGWYYPRYYYPPLYVPPPPGAVFFSFAVGVAWGAAMWGGCRWGWGHTHIDIDVNKHNTFINRTEISSRRTQLQTRAGESGWQHDPQHRKGVRYRDANTAQRFGASGSTRVSRDQARGYTADRTGQRPEPSRPNAGRPTARPSTSTATRPDVSRPTTRTTTRTNTSRPPASSQGRGALSGARSPSFDRAASNRGSVSRGVGGSRPSFGGGRR